MRHMQGRNLPREQMDKTERIETQSSNCPICRRVLDNARQVHGERGVSKEGDMIICAYCGACCRIKDNLELELVTAEELATYPKDIQDVVKATQSKIKQARLN